MLRAENGITLVALIITIIVLIILAAVSIATIYDSQIIQYATNGTENYVEAGKIENNIMNGTVSYIDSVVSSLQASQAAAE